MKKKRRGSGIIVKIVVIGFAIYAAVTLVTLQSSIDSEKNRIGDMEVQLEQQRQRNLQYSESLEGDVDDANMADIAREKLGLVAPGERVFYDVSK